MGILIDTSVLIRAERSPASIDFSQFKGLGDSYVSAISISELNVGAWRADTEARRQARLMFSDFVTQNHFVLGITLEIARVHAQIIADLLDNGTPIGLNDTWIAATARHHQLTVVTMNARDFSRVTGIAVIDVVTR